MAKGGEFSQYFQPDDGQGINQSEFLQEMNHVNATLRQINFPEIGNLLVATPENILATLKV